MGAVRPRYRPLLYRAADALDSSGGARDLADPLYADLYGMPEGGSERRSLFRYFQGRSSLATWLRAVLAQRYVDRLRAQKSRIEPLPDEDSAPPAGFYEGRERDPTVDPDRLRHVELFLLREALARAVSIGSTAVDRLEAQLLLCAGSHPRRNRTPAEGARSHGVAAARADRPGGISARMSKVNFERRPG